MRFERVDTRSSEAPASLWLMLPGAYMKPADFVAAGFDSLLREHGPASDVALLDAEIPQVADGSALTFLQDYLCSPEVDRYRHVHLLGISLGAHLALACLALAGNAAAAAAAARVRSACLLAPYLGPRDVVAEVAAAPPPFTWAPSADGADDVDRRIWHWLQRHAGGECRLHLGYGQQDRFAAAHALMARSLPAGCVTVVPGGHEWPVWTALWRKYLKESHEHA